LEVFFFRRGKYEKAYCYVYSYAREDGSIDGLERQKGKGTMDTAISIIVSIW